jgi:hypothetical protein
LKLIALTQDKYNGTFELNNHKIWGEYDTFSFYNDSLFKFFRWTDIGGLYGEGFYKIKDLKLTLYFGNTNYQTNYLVISKVPSDSENINYSFKVLNQLNKPLKDVVGIVRNVNNYYSADTTSDNYFKSDNDGIINIKINKNRIPASIIFSYENLQPLEINVKDSLSRVCNVILYEKKIWLSIIKKGTKLQFKIDPVSDDEFYLKQKGDDEWLLYKKSDHEFDINTYKY